MTNRFDSWISRGVTEAAGFRLAVPRQALRGNIGFQKGKHAGSSLEYKDFREYRPGDDLRHIDWSAYARSDRLTIKRFHEEITPHLDLVLDVSRSMDLPHTQKAGCAAGLAAFFAGAAANAGFHRTLWAAGGEVRRLPDGGRHPSTWQLPEFKHQVSPSAAALRTTPLKPQGFRIFISDLLWRGDPGPLLNALTREAASVLVVQVLAQADTRVPGRGKVKLVDSESGESRSLVLNASALKSYRETLARHQDLWQQTAVKMGIGLTRISAESFAADWSFGPEVFDRFLVSA